MSRAAELRAGILNRLAEKSADELDRLALQIPLRFSAAETLEERIARLLPYVQRGWSNYDRRLRSLAHVHRLGRRFALRRMSPASRTARANHSRSERNPYPG